MLQDGAAGAPHTCTHAGNGASGAPHAYLLTLQGSGAPHAYVLMLQEDGATAPAVASPTKTWLHRAPFGRVS